MAPAALGARLAHSISTRAFRRGGGGRGLHLDFAARLPSPPPPPSRFLHREAEGGGEMGEETRKAEARVTNVLLCGYDFLQANIYTREYLKDYPFIKVDDVALNDVPDVIHRYHLCVVKNRRFDAELIAKATEMKLLMQFGVGLEGVDVKAATEHNIRVARIPGSSTGNAIACSEMAIYLVLGLLRKQKEMDIAVKQKRLGEPIGETLFGKTVFILGFGAIGVELAKRLRPFGVKILANKRKWPVDSTSSVPSSGNTELNNLVDRKGGPEHIYEFAGEADIVVTCLTMNTETAGIVDGRFLSSMKKGSLLVNIARGGVLDYNAVYNHLESGHLGGLGIDVAWTEPFDPEDPILKFANVIITPHVAGVTEYSYRTMAKIVADCALQLHAGKPLTGIEYVN